MPQLPDLPEIEYLDGFAHRKMSQKTRHAAAQSALAHIIQRCAGERGLAGTEWRFRFGPSGEKHTSLVPDVAFVSAERLRGIPPAERDEPTIAPEIAVEVRSPSDDLPFLRSKIARYLELGTLLVLDVQPAARRITAHATGATRTFTSSDRFENAAVPWLTFDVAEAFVGSDWLDRL